MDIYGLIPLPSLRISFQSLGPDHHAPNAAGYIYKPFGNFPAQLHKNTLLHITELSAVLSGTVLGVAY